MNKTEDSKNLRVDTRPFIVELGVAPLGLPVPRVELAGARVKLPTRSEIYVIDPNGYRRWIPDPDTYNNLFRDWNGVIIDLDINDIPAAAPLTSGAVLMRASNAAPVYIVSNGIKRWITSPAAMDKYYFNWARIYVLPSVVVDSVQRGPDWT